MRRLTTNEVLSLNALLQMETNGLAVSRGTMSVMGDEQLKNLTQAGITAAEARIRGLQQFVAENHVIGTEEEAR